MCILLQQKVVPELVKTQKVYYFDDSVYEISHRQS